MTNHYVKYEDFVINSFQDNQKKSCGLLKDRPTNISKTKNPFSSKGGITNWESVEQNHFVRASGKHNIILVNKFNKFSNELTQI
jgi:hypothetical protein